MKDWKPNVYWQAFIMYNFLIQNEATDYGNDVFHANE